MGGEKPSELLDKLIADLGDWRGQRIERIRRLIHEVDPDMVLEWKWMGTPVWYHNGMVACVNPHTGKVKLTFAQGANLPDPAKLFNAGLGGNEWRAVDIFETDALNERALKDLVRAAVAFNQAKMGQPGGATPKKTSKPAARKPRQG
ncbi:MAG TPA: DUF1801 domain-containing protein [Thermoplasmata archaeon]|jgi:hypothetical protein